MKHQFLVTETLTHTNILFSRKSPLKLNKVHRLLMHHPTSPVDFRRFIIQLRSKGNHTLKK